MQCGNGNGMLSFEEGLPAYVCTKRVFEGIAVNQSWRLRGSIACSKKAVNKLSKRQNGTLIV
jgi:hypothetical protein